MLWVNCSNPVLSTLKYFRNEYDAHVKEKCPAGECTNLVNYSINDNCKGCTGALKCPVKAIKEKEKENIL